MKQLLIGLVLVVGCGYFVGEERPRKAAEDMGFTAVTVTSRSVVLSGWNGCGKDDGVEFDAVATNVNKAKVNLTICCGAILKGCTVRSR